ncbi:unnamed protein product [Closterium sp. NIES-54]
MPRTLPRARLNRCLARAPYAAPRAPYLLPVARPISCLARGPYALPCPSPCLTAALPCRSQSYSPRAPRVQPVQPARRPPAARTARTRPARSPYSPRQARTQPIQPAPGPRAASTASTASTRPARSPYSPHQARAHLPCRLHTYTAATLPPVLLWLHYCCSLHYCSCCTTVIALHIVVPASVAALPCLHVDGLSLFDLMTGASLAPTDTADSATRSQRLTRDAAARLAVRNHLPLAERAHFGQHKTARALYDTVVTRYSSPATAALARLILPYLFQELSAFDTITDLVTHFCTSDVRYQAALPAEFLAKNPPPMYITLYFIVTRLSGSLSAVRNLLLALDPTDLTVDLLEKHLLAAETSIVASVDIFALDYDAILATMHALNICGEGDCYLCMPPDPGIEAVALGVSESALPSTARVEALHTFKLDLGSSRCFFRDSTTVTPLPAPVAIRLADPSGGPVLARSSTVLPCPAVLSRSLSGLHLPSFSVNLVSTAALQNAMVTTTTPGGQRVSICTCTPTSRHLATFTRRPGSSLYTLTTEPSQVAASASTSDLPVLRVHSDRGGEFASDLLRDFCRGEGIRQTFTLPASPQQNGVAEHHIGLVMEVTRTSMIHAAAPHFLWPFAVRYAVHQLNLWPHVSLPETSPTLRWTEEVGDASVFRFWGSCTFVRDTSVDKLSSRAIPCVFLGFPLTRLAGSFTTPPCAMSCPLRTSRLTNPLPPQGCAPSGVSQVDPAEHERAEPGAGRPATGDPGVGGVGAAGTRGAGAASLGGARTGGTGAAGASGTADIGAGDPGAGGVGAAGPGGTRTGGDGAAGGAGATGPGGAGATGAYGAVGVGAGDPRAGGASPWAAGAVGPGSVGTAQPGSYFSVVSLRLALPCLFALVELVVVFRIRVLLLSLARTTWHFVFPLFHCEIPLPSPPASSRADGPDTQSDLLRAASPTVTRFLVTVVTDPSFESTSASGLVAELAGFATAFRLDYAASLVAEAESVCPPSVGGECALGMDVLEDTHEDFECFAAAVHHLVSMLIAPEGDSDAPDIPTPRTYTEAISGLNSYLWQTAMDVRTYVDAVPPPGANIVDGMWIFRVKRPPGSPPVFKAHYVVRGFSQRQGVDFFHTFSPTPKMTTLRVLLHVAAQRDYELHSLDFSTAFLQGTLHEDSWLRHPSGFIGSFPIGTEWSLHRPVYGLRQAPREWHNTLRTTLAALGFAPSTADPSLFLRTDTSLPLFHILVYVDDLVFATTDTERLALVKSELQKRHTCTDLGELRSYLGLQITTDIARRTITSTQSHMVQQVLQHFDFEYSSPQSTPLPIEILGCLMYLMTCTQPDIAYPLGIVASHVALRRHPPVHWKAAKRVMRYLCSTLGMGLVLGGQSRVVLTGHADASWVDDLATQRSSQGYTFNLGSGSVSWRSTHSSSVLRSTCEAEIYARAMAVEELRWLTYLLTDLGEPPCSPPVLYVVNKAMIALCQDHRLKHRTKHIALRYFLARELQQHGQLRLAYVASWANTAFIFTKELQPCFDHCTACSL